MISQTIDLYSYYNIEKADGFNGKLKCFVHENTKNTVGRKRPAVLVIAGGAYSGISDRENEPVAISYYAKGFNAFTLDYSVAPIRFPSQLQEGMLAVSFIKDNAEKLNVIADKVCAVGFSAGGHLAAMLATLYDNRELLKNISNVKLQRADAVILGYPVITSGEYAHTSSIENLIGDNKDFSDTVSMEKQVTSNSAPAFIWGTVDDNLVPSENALLYAIACKKNNVAFELHLFANGPHGLSLANKETATPKGTPKGNYDNPDVQVWFDLSLNWLKNIGFSIRDV